MSQSFRHPDILDIARKEGRVTVDDLASRFDVTAQTIRRDLNELADSGQLERVHGGAVWPSGVANIVYDERALLNADAKTAIGRACAAVIPNNASIFLNIGTTTEAVAKELLDHEDILVMTNNLNVANILVQNPRCEIVVAGGTFRRSDGGLVGNLTTRAIEAFKFDYAVIGCSALDLDGDILDFDSQEVFVSQTILRRSRKRILVADHSKLERTAPVRIGSLEDIDVMVTDRVLPATLAGAVDGWDLAVEVVG